MKDLTRNAIERHLLTLATPVVVNMVAQIASQLINLYFITKAGTAATAGVNAAASATYCASALAQVLAVGSTPLIAQAVGRRDRTEAKQLFNQSISLAMCLGLLTTLLLGVFIYPYMRLIAADEETARAGISFMMWNLPGLALLLPLASLGSAVRGTGVVKPYIINSTLTLVLDAILAPILIAGWGTGVPLGVVGAGLASSLSILGGVMVFAAYFQRPDSYLRIDLDVIRPRLQYWHRMLRLGLPAGAELILAFLSTTVIYYTIRNFGAATQAGFGIGSRVLQVIVLPGMAIGFAAAPIAAQNFGARDWGRVRETFYKAALISTSIMAVVTFVVREDPGAFVRILDAPDPATTASAMVFLKLMSWNLIAQGLLYVCSSMFQGLGNTVPSLLSSVAQFLLSSALLLWFSTQSTFGIQHVWYIMIASIALQAILSMLLLRLEFHRRLLHSA